MRDLKLRHIVFALGLNGFNQSRGSENKNGLDKDMSKTAITQKLACCSSLLDTLVSKWLSAELYTLRDTVNRSCSINNNILKDED